jgi:hypothetical protein
MGETKERPCRKALHSCPSLLYTRHVELRKILTLQGDVTSSSPDRHYVVAPDLLTAVIETLTCDLYSRTYEE